MIKKQATNLAAIRKGDNIIAKVYKGDTLRYNAEHSITYNLDGIVTPSQTKVKHNAPFTLSFTTESGKVLLPSTVRVTMGGVNITITAYDWVNNEINIPNITGDVSITAEAAVVDSAYKPILYIESLSGKAVAYYTDYTPNHKTQVTMDVKIPSASAKLLLGVAGRNPNTANSAANPRYFLWSQYSDTYPRFFFYNKTNNNTTKITTARGIISIDKGVVEYLGTDGLVKTINASVDNTFAATNYLSVFGFNKTVDQTYSTGGEIYRIMIKEEDVLLRDYIPVVRLSDNKVGLYDIKRGQPGEVMEASNYIMPNILTTRTYSNCAATRLSAGTTGTATRAVIGSTWSIKLTPSSDYTFAGGVSPQVKIANIDVTSQVVTDNGDGTYTITIVNVPQEPIEITAEAVALPYDAEVEYLESDGTAYINTDIVLTQAHIIDIVFTHRPGQRLIGARDNNTNYISFGIYNTIVDINGTNAALAGRFDMSSYLTEDTIYKVHAENGNRYLADQSGTIIATNNYTAKSFSTNRKTPVFGLRWASDAVTPAVGRILSLSITYNGSKVLDFIPVRKDGVGYLYDKVSGQLFGNAASSGAFTFGSDVTSNGTNSLNFNNGLLGSINGDEPNDEPNEIDPIAMEDM